MPDLPSINWCSNKLRSKASPKRDVDANSGARFPSNTAVFDFFDFGATVNLMGRKTSLIIPKMLMKPGNGLKLCQENLGLSPSNMADHL